MAQADKMRAKATKADGRAEHGAPRRAAAGRPRGGAARRPGGARSRSPSRRRAGRTPLTAARAVEVVRLAGGLHRRRPRDRPGQPGRRPRPQRRRQDHAAAHPRRASRRPTPARCCPGTGCKLGYYAQEHETLDIGAHGAGEHADRRARPRPTPRCARCSARSCSPATTSTSRPACCPAARRPGWRWRPWSCRAPTCCCSTSRRTTSTRPAARRCSARCARYAGAIVLVTHDEGAVEALEPERVLLLPDGVEDLWSADYLDLVALA